MAETEYQEFLDSFEKTRFHGLRANTLKITPEAFSQISPFSLKTIPWCEEGFYYPSKEEPGKHPYYYAGLYYIQEPSAMLPANILSAKPGEKVLDLCAAPGGKTLQLAAQMQRQGLLVANEINSDRAKALLKNIELYGASNVLVTNETPENLAQKLPVYFDKILVDAPCSGEGTFRKDKDSIKNWEKYSQEKCSHLQKQILKEADKMLKEGGYIVYSTCTFAPEENEHIIYDFLQQHKNYELVDIPKKYGIEKGRSGWCHEDEAIGRTARLWPHRIEGEGHFVSLLWKKESITKASFPTTSPKSPKFIPGYQKVYQEFCQNHLTQDLQGIPLWHESSLFLLPCDLPELTGIRVLKFCWYIGQITREEFEPSHSLICALSQHHLQKKLDFSHDSEEITRYIRGESLRKKGEKGLVAICMDGYTLGWAKYSADMLKNLYPKGWRRMC